MRKMAAVRQVHTENRVPGLQYGRIRGFVRLRTGVRLYICVFRIEKLFGPLPCQSLYDVDELASAVISLSWIALGVLVCEYAPSRFQHRFGGEVLARDQFDSRILSLQLMLYRVIDLRVCLCQTSRHSSLLIHGSCVPVFCSNCLLHAFVGMEE